eukprot:gene16708-18404_t
MERNTLLSAEVMAAKANASPIDQNVLRANEQNHKANPGDDKGLLISSSAVNNTVTLRWRKLSYKGLAPSQRRDCAIGYNREKNEIVIFGGRENSMILSDTWILNIANESWHMQPVTKGVQPPSIYAGTYGNNNKSFIIGFGKSSVEKVPVFNDIYRFDFNASEWSLIKTQGNKPVKRYFMGGGLVGERLMISQGRGESSLVSDAYGLDLKEATWKKSHDSVNQYAPYFPHARYGQASAALSEHQLLMFGGCLSGEKSAGPCPSSDSWIMETKTSNWKKVQSCSSPRMNAAMALLPTGTSNSNVAVLYGGKESSKQTIKVYNEALIDEVATYDEQDGKWQRKITQKDPVHGYPEMRFGHSMTTTTTGIAVFGGESLIDGKLLNDVWILEGDPKASRNSPTKQNCSRYTNLIAIHGILMFISWGIILQLAGFIARYLKTKGNLWYNLHRGLSTIGLVIAIAGFILGIISVRGNHFSFAHGAIGLDIMLAGIYQPLNAVFRPAAPKEEEKPKQWRRIWEISHRFTGRIALLLARISCTKSSKKKCNHSDSGDALRSRIWGDLK